MSLLQKIDEALAKKQAERATKERSGLWSPSSFGRCLRAQYWNRLNEPYSDKPDARSLRVFAVGDLFHDFVQQFVPTAQVEVECKWEDVSGRADVVDETAVYDIKSQHSKGFHYMRQAGYDIKKEKECNWLQLATYGMILHKPNIHLVIISKDDLLVNEYADITTHWIPKVIEELKNLRGYWDKKELPPCQPRAYGGKEGKYCNWRSKCLGMNWDCVNKRKV